MDVYRIAKWAETFETSESRRYKSLTWVSLPLGYSNGYNELVEQFQGDAPAIYGAWCALVRIAATAPERGTLATSKGKPWSIERIASETRFPSEVFEKLFAWALQEEVGWIERVPPVCHPGDTQATNGLLNLTNLTNLTDCTDLTQVSVKLVSQQDFLRMWPEIRVTAESLKKKLEPDRRLTARNRELTIRLATMCQIHPVWNALIFAKAKIASENGRKPWGLLKSSVINASKEHGYPFDAQWEAIAIPEQILTPPVEAPA